MFVNMEQVALMDREGGFSNSWTRCGKRGGRRSWYGRSIIAIWSGRATSCSQRNLANIT